MFADDLKLYYNIKSTEDCIELQSNLDRLVGWSAKNKLDFNISKCAVVTFNRIKNPIQFDYNINKIKINRFKEMKDLGCF